jgi:fluoroacetyl-CoA thioesterase
MMAAGMVNERTWVVSKEHLASAFGSGLVDVLATPVLVGFCEEAARTLAEPHLPEGQKTVGTAVSLTHTAATPPGMKVTVRATLTAIEGRKLCFDIECHDEIESVGHCSHNRFVIDAARFEAGIVAKAAKASAARNPR